ncbi:hypothetical protein [Billgrantia antri]|uniref:hypothetical protein n=1 Tax=Billgrantia antri TaxID=2846777 RepID=UPI003B212128
MSNRAIIVVDIQMNMSPPASCRWSGIEKAVTNAAKVLSMLDRQRILNRPGFLGDPLV